MKNRFLFLLIVLVAMLVTACAPAAQGFVALPDLIKIGITGVVVWLVSFFFAKLIAWIPILVFLEQFRHPLALAIAAALIGWVQNIVPDAFGAIAIIGIQLLLAILAFFGVGEVLKAKAHRGEGWKAFK
jgi:hypothetical protein